MTDQPKQNGGARPGAGTPKRLIKFSLVNAKRLREMAQANGVTLEEMAERAVEEMYLRHGIEQGRKTRAETP